MQIRSQIKDVSNNMGLYALAKLYIIISHQIEHQTEKKKDQIVLIKSCQCTEISIESWIKGNVKPHSKLCMQ